jgi:hypothetical protein
MSPYLGHVSIGITAQRYCTCIHTKDNSVADAFERSSARSEKGSVVAFLLAPAGFEFCGAVLADPVRY